MPGAKRVKKVKKMSRKEHFFKKWRLDNDEFIKGEDENLKYWKTVSEKIYPIPKRKKGFLD